MLNRLSKNPLALLLVAFGLGCAAHSVASTSAGAPRIPLDALAAPLTEDALANVLLRMCGTNAVFQGESLASYTTFVRRAVELRAEPEWLDRESPAPRTGTWGRAPT
ncbi:MAG: hypothetical protein CMN30_22070 [Sandaracinus sp.]|nr:hypothetical protein [Sandaracinus sp.]